MMKNTILSIAFLVGLHSIECQAKSDHQSSELMKIIKRVDSIVESKNPKVSKCAGFSYLMDKIYTIKGGRPMETLSAVSLYLGDTSVIYGKMLEGAKRLEKVKFDVLAKPIRETLIFEWNSKTRQIWDQEKFHSVMQLGPNGQPTLSTKNRITDVTGFIPLWLSDHGAISTALNPGIDPGVIGNQTLHNGYTQLADDSDGTGRHDHLIGNMILGYNAEKLALKSSNQAEALVFRWIAKAAPLADEYLDPNQNKSPTDVKVNKNGVNLGMLLAEIESRGKKLKTNELNKAVFKSICDESELSHLEHPGPVNSEVFEGL